jgi:hypothetical protein
VQAHSFIEPRCWKLDSACYVSKQHFLVVQLTCLIDNGHEIRCLLISVFG